ncbi:MAG: deoxynucleoside kinase [Micavibrio aeruginosavorus]|uniref:Deoxynucleoside kinase n=1 Tax=Micavibrio aeruginosavorus TaxID=349221 RepID=A0A7T5UGX7_9BACT|nr:MAG: deoxynucleoside kinase [Micavibrio aeruginosavorus]
MSHIEIIAGVGAGKTSLGKALSGYGFSFIPEEFETNPFLTAFHQDPRSCAFEFGMTMLMMHYNKINQRPQTDRQPVYDFSLVTNEAYARSYLDFALMKPGLADLYIRSTAQARKESVKPAARIFLELRPETQIERIRKRGRELEREDRTTLDFIRILQQYLGDIASGLNDGVPLIRLDAERYNWVDSEKDKAFAARFIRGETGRGPA